MSISPARRRAILAAHDGVCHYCGIADAAHVDHIVPRADGGTDDLGNLIAACLPCNLYKRRHRLPPDAEMRALARAEELRPAVLTMEAPAAVKPVRTMTEVIGEPISPGQCRAGRAALDWTQERLAVQAKVGLVTIRQFEGEKTARPQRSIVAAIRLALEAAGVGFQERGVFLVSDGRGVRMRTADAQERS